MVHHSIYLFSWSYFLLSLSLPMMVNRYWENAISAVKIQKARMSVVVKMGTTWGRIIIPAGHSMNPIKRSLLHWYSQILLTFNKSIWAQKTYRWGDKQKQQVQVRSLWKNGNHWHWIFCIATTPFVGSPTLKRNTLLNPLSFHPQLVFSIPLRQQMAMGCHSVATCIRNTQDLKWFAKTSTKSTDKKKTQKTKSKAQKCGTCPNQTFLILTQ